VIYQARCDNFSFFGKKKNRQLEKHKNAESRNFLHFCEKEAYNIAELLNMLLIQRISKHFLPMFPKCQFLQTTTTSISMFIPQQQMDEDTI